MFETWITNRTAAPFYARKEFTVQKEVVSATAKVCGLGQFILSLNGQKIGDHELDPGWTDYRKLAEYVTFDVRDALRMGDNVLGVEVGNGWFHRAEEHYIFHFPDYLPKNPNGYHPFSDVLVLALELEIDYVDGTKEVIAADDSFLVKEHETVMSNVYGSETIDKRRSQPGWNTVSFSAEDWEAASPASPEEIPSGKMIEQLHPATKVTKTYEGKLLYRKSGRDIYDFGQNLSGLLDFEIRGEAGSSVRIYPAEKLLADGDIDQTAKNWTVVDSCITAIAGKEDGFEHCRMKFTYFAGRYAAVEYIPAEGSGQMPEIRSLRADALTDAWQEAGTFRCDDERYMQIYHLVEKAVENNMVCGVHTDCPTIERFAWQEVNHLMAPSVYYMKEGKGLFEKFLMDMRSCQHTADDWFDDGNGGRYYPGEGTMPAQCPCYDPSVLPVPGIGDMYDIIVWGSTCILGAYQHYLFYGDKQIIADNYEAGMRYLNHVKTRVNGDGFVCYGLGDWGNPHGEYAKENVETAFLYADAVTLAKSAEILGKSDDQKTLMQYAGEVKENYNQKLLVWNEDWNCFCYRCFDHPDSFFTTQASLALPLFFEMVPGDKVQDVEKAFRMTLKRDDAFIAGEVGLPYVIQTARKLGMNDLISRLILKKGHPSYYAFVQDGETTLGEYFESNPRSHCHDMMGSIIEWYYNGIAGILPEKPGFSEVTIRPYLPESVHAFSCSYHSASGEISVCVIETEDEIHLKVSCEKGIRFQIDPSTLSEKQKRVVLEK